MINPALALYPAEAAFIGAMVVGYGEIDIAMVSAAGSAAEIKFELLDAVDEVNSERIRIEIIRKLTKASFEKVGLAEQFEIAIAAMHECREVRNYFAHCHYGYFHEDTGLLSLKARDLFAGGNVQPEDLPWRRLTLDTLSRQEKFFDNTRAWWLWLEFTLPHARQGEKSPVNQPPRLQSPPRDAGPYVHDPERPPYWKKPRPARQS